MHLNECSVISNEHFGKVYTFLR
ncbi:hypothetical protein LINPERHAP2_LOCUS34032 [Linum perenne]